MAASFACGLVEHVRVDHGLKFLLFRADMVSFRAFSGGLPLGGLDLSVAEFHEAAVALLIIGRAADVDRVRQEVLDDALMPERAEHRRDAQIVEPRRQSGRR